MNSIECELDERKGQGRWGLKSGDVWMNSIECDLDERKGREGGG